MVSKKGGRWVGTKTGRRWWRIIVVAVYNPVGGGGHSYPNMQILLSKYWLWPASEYSGASQAVSFHSTRPPGATFKPITITHFLSFYLLPVHPLLALAMVGKMSFIIQLVELFQAPPPPTPAASRRSSPRL